MDIAAFQIVREYKNLSPDRDDDAADACKDKPAFCGKQARFSETAEEKQVHKPRLHCKQTDVVRLVGVIPCHGSGGPQGIKIGRQDRNIAEPGHVKIGDAKDNADPDKQIAGDPDAVCDYQENEQDHCRSQDIIKNNLRGMRKVPVISWQIVFRYGMRDHIGKRKRNAGRKHHDCNAKRTGKLCQKLRDAAAEKEQHHPCKKYQNFGGKQKRPQRQSAGFLVCLTIKLRVEHTVGKKPHKQQKQQNIIYFCQFCFPHDVSPLKVYPFIQNYIVSYSSLNVICKISQKYRTDRFCNCDKNK